MRKNQNNSGKLKIPETTDVLGIVTKILGNARFTVSCSDGKIRVCRVRGSMRRRVWIKKGDLVLVSPWDFQSDKKGDIIWRYRAQDSYALKKEGFLVPSKKEIMATKEE